MADMRWLPLESNPDVMNKYVKNLGASGDWQFVDVFGLDPDLLMMVPKPVASVLLLYPITEKSEASPLGDVKDTKDVYFIKQTIGNACGTMALIHALANNTSQISLGTGALSSFLEKTKSKSPEDKAKDLETEQGISAAHEESALEGQTQAPSRDEKVTLHFVAFVEVKGSLYELDGRKAAPTCHGPTTADTLLEDTVAVVKKFMARDPEELNFSLVALAKS